MDKIAEYTRVVEDVRSTIARQIARLRTEWTPEASDEERAVFMWQVALLTCLWDVSTAAIRCCESNDMRVARILDRSLSEYAYNLHFYARYPGKALDSAKQYETYLRRILRPTAPIQGDMTDEQFAAFQAFVSNGSTFVSYEKTRAIRKAAVDNLGMLPEYIDKALDHLDSEYSISSGIAHGSQGLFADVYRNIDGHAGYHERSPWFTPTRTASRIACHLILALVAVDAVDAAGMHMRSLRLQVDREEDQSVQIYTENVIYSVLCDALRA